MAISPQRTITNVANLEQQTELAAKAADQAEDKSFLDTALLSLYGGTLGFNAVSSIAGTIARKMDEDSTVDPNYSFKEHSGELLADIPAQYWNRFNGSTSYENALSIREGIEMDMFVDKEIAEAGTKGVASILAVSLFDADMLIPGMAASKASRLKRALSTAKTAGIANIATESMLTTVKENDRYDVINAGLFGVGFGGAIGGFSYKPDRVINDVNNLRDLDENNTEVVTDIAEMF